MKKIIGIVLFLIALACSATVKPFYFENVQDTAQQITWNELMKYKLWGTNYFSVGNGVIVPDESGRNGTIGNLIGTGSETLLGGPIIVTGDINVGNGYTFPTGPTVANSFTMGNLNNGYFGGIVCLIDTNVTEQVKRGLEKGGGILTNSCDNLPKATGLSIPLVEWPDSTLHEFTVAMHTSDTINIPSGEGEYDIYLSGLTMDQESKLYIRLPDEGRLVRIFVNGNISLGNHAVIQTMKGETLISNDDYGGNLMFYTTEDLLFAQTDYCIRQGTYISAKTFTMNSNVTFAGQMLANRLVIGDQVDGKNFLYVPFDPPIINLGDPKTNALGNFIENDSTVQVPIFLDTLAPGKVIFNYCFILNESATLDDFNTDITPIHVCDESEGVVIIEEGDSLPKSPVLINVKLDEVIEGTEVVGLKIYNVSGAALPSNKKTHVFTLTLTDGFISNHAPVIDTTAKFKFYDEEQKIINKSNLIGEVKVTDEYPEKLVWSIIDSTGYFIIDSGKVYTNHVFDYETEDSIYTVLIKVSDGEFADSGYFDIKINNIQEDIVIDAQIDKVYENTEIGTVIGLITGKDADSTKVTYSINDKTFAIDKNSGIITVNGLLDYETKSKYPVTVTVKSEDGSVKDTAFIINILNINEPVHVNDTTFTINENLKGNIGKITAWDEDDDKIYYSVSDTNRFEIKYDGVLVLKTPYDYEKTKIDSIKVYVEDGNNMIDSAWIKIKINDVNEPLHIDTTSIVIPEDTKIGTILDTIHGYDEDGEKITYTLIDTDIVKIKDSIITLNKNVDYEKINEYIIKVIALTSKDKDTISIPLKITNVNEPIHVNDTTLTIPENKIGEIGKVTAWDEDNDKITYTVSDTAKYNIDSNGVISLKIPFDYEKQSKDSVWVYVKDPSGLTDSAKIKINVKNEIENSEVKIIATETKDSLWHSDTVYTNDPNINIEWKGDGKLNFTDTTVVPGKNIIAVCYHDSTKDNKACDSVVVMYSKDRPIVSISKVGKDSSFINGITIVEEVAKTDSNIYVNKKENDIQVTVTDKTSGKKENFIISVELDTINISKKHYETYPYIVNTDNDSLPYTVINDNKRKYTETIKVDGQIVNLYYYADSTGKPLDTLRYVEYTKVINGQNITFTYTTDDMGLKVSDYTVRYEYIDKNDNKIDVSYNVDNDGKIQKNKDGSVGYNISYTYTNKYGNSSTSEIFIALETIPPKVKILSPLHGDDYYNNSVNVVWTVDEINQDTLTIERLEKGVNTLVRMYKDKYGNIGSDTVYIYMKNAKDIEIALVKPITEVKQDKVDKYYSEHKYDKKKPFQVMIKDPKSDSIPEPVGVGLKVNIVLPSLSSTGGLATIDDMIQTINGKPGILVNKNGELISGTSTGADGSYTISTDDYINKHCTDEFKKEYRKNGLEHTTVWNVKYNMHIWIFNNNANYVNDFKFDYTLDDTKLANDAGQLQMIVDWLPAKDGNIKSADGNAIQTGAFIGKIEATSISTVRCNLPSQPIGTKIKKSEYDMKTFGYKRPNN